MTAIANLLDPRTAERLAAVRAEAERLEHHALEGAAAAPVRPPACESCGRPFPVAPVVFRAAGGTAP